MTRPPEQIGAYSVDCEIGRGGMGVVFRAKDSYLDRSVAIKALPDHLANHPDVIARFEREARALAALNHSNIAGIHGIEEQDGLKYLVLEYVDGETLAERLTRGPLRLGEAIELVSEIAGGLEVAHDAGFVHRDLKPANIKITSHGVAKILDFGLVRVEATGEGHASTCDAPTHAYDDTSPGTILGTMQYMSPEQARGMQVDRRADIWSLGVVLYECLTGTNPFAKDLPAGCLELSPFLG